MNAYKTRVAGRPASFIFDQDLKMIGVDAATALNLGVNLDAIATKTARFRGGAMTVVGSGTIKGPLAPDLRTAFEAAESRALAWAAREAADSI